MYCPKCGAQIANGSLFCGECYTKLAVAEQNKKIDAALEKQKNVLYEFFKKPIFLLATVLFTVSAVLILLDLFVILSMINVIAAFFLTPIFGALPLTFMAISIVGHWQGYLAKKGGNLPKIINRIAVLDWFSMISTIINLIMSALTSMVYIFLIGVVLFMFSLAAGTEFVFYGFMVLFVLMIFVLLIFVFASPALAFAVFSIIGNLKRLKYFRELSSAEKKNEYRVQKLQSGWSYTLGGLSIAVGFLFSLVVLSGAFEMLILFEVLCSIAGAFLTFLIFALIGVYYILFAYWTKLHEAKKKAQAEVDAERAALAYIERQTAEAIYKAAQLKRSSQENS